MAWTLKASVTGPGIGGGPGTFTLGPINTTGSDLIVIANAGGGSSATPTDSAGNTWISIQASNSAWIWYAHNVTTSSSHTFTIDNPYYQSGVVLAYSGSRTTSAPLDQSNSGSGYQPGSITPTTSGELIVDIVCLQSSSPPYTFDSGFTNEKYTDYVAGVNYGIVAADFVQSAAAAINPAMSPTAPALGSSIASFIPAPTVAAAPTIPHDFPVIRPTPLPGQTHTLSNARFLRRQPVSFYSNYDQPNPRGWYRLDETWINPCNNFPPLLAARPIIQSDWPLPQRRTPSFDYFWTSGVNPPITVLMMLPFMWDVNDTQPYWDKFYSQSRQLVPPAVFPFSQPNWPLPTRGPPLDYFWANGINSMPSFSALIMLPSMWDVNDTPLYWDRFWSQRQIAQAIPIPFSQTDWPNPKPTPPGQTYTFSGVQFLSRQPVSYYFNYDQPNPRAWYRPDVTWLNPCNNFPPLPPPPFLPINWQNPQALNWYRDWALNLLESTLQPVIAAPFSQEDWPLPKTYQPILQFWSNSLNLLPIPTAIPFSQSDWKVTPQQLYWNVFWFQNLVSLLSSQPVSFYNTYDWPNPPKVQVYWDKSYTPGIPPSLISVLNKPFNQSHYPNPRTFTPIDPNWFYSVLNLVSLANPKPFNQAYWPLTKAPQPIDPTYLLNIINLYPPPPPPPAPIGGGRQITEEEVQRELQEWYKKLTEYGKGEYSRSEHLEKSSLGGFRRADVLSKAQKADIATLGALTRWEK